MLFVSVISFWFLFGFAGQSFTNTLVRHGISEKQTANI